MPSVHKFLFDTCFDHSQGPDPRATPAPDPEPLPEPEPEPHYTEADLAAAREQAFVEGRTAGAAEAQAAIERAAATALETIARGIGTLVEAQNAADDSRIRQTVETAIAITRKLHPELVQRHGLTEVEGVLRRCLETLRDEPRLVVRVADALLDALTPRIDELAQANGFDGKIVVLADEAIAPGDCRVEWADGGVERTSAAIWNDIEAAIRRALAGLPDTGPAPQAATADPPLNEATGRPITLRRAQ